MSANWSEPVEPELVEESEQPVEPLLSPVVVGITRDEIQPGMRCVDGVWLYSARWL